MKTKKPYLFFILSFFVILSLYSPSIVKTGGNFVLASVNEVILPGLGENPTLPQYISFIFNFVMQLAGSLALLAVTFGGLRYLASFGSPTAKNAGKEWVKAGILGLLLLMCSYLILYTINKDLVSLKMSLLGIPLPTVNIPDIPEVPKISEMTYVELPIGTLTENTLSRASDYCYEFDLNGDPIDGKLGTGDIYEPSIEDHDRLDCALKIYDAVERKAKIFSLLSEEIAKLMDKCSCGGNCDQNCSKCAWKGGSCPRDEKYIGTSTLCTGNCVNASCKKKPAKNVCPDICIKNNNILDINVSTDAGKIECAIEGGKIVGAKGIIENGPIKISIDCPECGEKTYKGLSEFRTTRTEISSFVEKEITINGKKVKIIQKDKWSQLKLIEQLMYFKEKINKIKEDLKTDSDTLKQVENEISKCYLVKSSVDFWKITEGNENIKYGEIIIQKDFEDPITNQTVDSSKYCKGYNYSDSSCFSFCRKMCFPTTNPESFKGLKACDKNNFKCLEDNFYKCASNSFGFTNMQECFTGCRSECSTSCDLKYPKLGTPECPDKNKDCGSACDTNLSNCKKECDKKPSGERTTCKNICDTLSSKCKASCDKSSPKCEDKNQACKDVCAQDSEYILNQDENCFGNNFKSAKNCADAYDESDFESFKRCIELSTCSFCTDQYAGYPDCSKNLGASSSLYLYKNPAQQKCQSCYQDPKVKEENKKCKNDCSDDDIEECSKSCDTKYPIYEGVENNPECQKCSACSICPKCPCKDGCSISCDSKYPKDPDENKKCKKTCSECSASCDTKYPKNSDENKSCKKICGDQNQNCSQIEEKALFCSADCVESAYNQDPLTFYCRTDWWKEVGTGTSSSPDKGVIEDIKNAEGLTKEEKDELIKEEQGSSQLATVQSLRCLKGEEIPIGETVDGVETWADNMVKFIAENAIKKLDDIINYIGQIGKEASYCECNSKCSATENACPSNCMYGQAEMEDPDTGEKYWSCFCTKSPCTGNPCQKVINLLRGKKKESGCPKDVEYKGVALYQQEVTKTLKEFEKAVQSGDRSDLLKKLTYSRKKMQDCGVVSSLFGGGKKAISCIMAKDYFVAPVTSWSVIINSKKYKNQCYGLQLGEILKSDLMDNWECCETTATTTVIGKNE